MREKKQQKYFTTKRKHRYAPSKWGEWHYWTMILWFFFLLLSKYYGTWWCAIFAKDEWIPILFNYLTILMNEIIHGGILLTYVFFFSSFQQVLSVFTLYFVGLCYVWRWCLIQTRNINHNYIIRRFVRAIWLIMTFQLNLIQWVFRRHSVYWPESKVTTWMDICVYYWYQVNDMP